ncbi:PREDICTED: desmoglein-4-like [Cyprinodon variegatus]|uniref:desmoglein-4-like n=1 Tax=Cyprinodon variegatus TaxID=28743 RepID=UPI0007428E18|nr:PREDICTED: desmoglein-4-like [Cyprinodon variegatus]
MTRRSMSFLLLILFGIQAAVLVSAYPREHLVRHQKRWSVPPRLLSENRDYTQWAFIAKIRSDHAGMEKITYSLEGIGANQYPYHVFVVDPHTGYIRVTKILDREDIARYQYEATILENTQNVEVMRLKAEDLDEENTDNWVVVYEIVKGNEAGYFSIKKDPITGEHILMLDKAVDFEDVKNLNLGLAVRNKAPMFNGSIPNGGASIGFGGGPSGPSGASGASGSSSSSGTGGSGGKFKTYPIKINVKNQAEGPHFEPAVKAIPVTEGSESFTVGQVISSYPPSAER